MLVCAPIFGATKIKIGTAAPKGSSFDTILVKMGEAWKAQGANVSVYSGGVKGGEGEMVRLMRNDALDAGLLSAVGLSEIDPGVEALQSIPMMFRSLDEVDYVGEHLRPRLEKKLRDKGFVVLFWADTGWVRFFSKAPIVHPADLRAMKLFTWRGDDVAVDGYKTAGFRPVPLETDDIITGLKTKLIDAVPMPPYVALATQVYTSAPYMVQLDWAPLVGALVITERTWNKFTPEQQRGMAQIAAKTGAAMKANNRRESDAAVAVMKTRKMKVTTLTPAIEEEWRTLAAKSYPLLRTRKIGPELFDEVVKLLTAYRSSATK
jgi:TRAP-type C4-dicarboxylate transport system substrate-binding protein